MDTLVKECWSLFADGTLAQHKVDAEQPVNWPCKEQNEWNPNKKSPDNRFKGGYKNPNHIADSKSDEEEHRHRQNVKGGDHLRTSIIGLLP